MGLLQSVRSKLFPSFFFTAARRKYSIYDAPADDWEIILSLAHRWQFPGVKDLAIRELHKIDLSVVDRIVLYQRYDIGKEFLVPLYMSLCSQDDPLSIEDSVKLGVHAATMIFHAREKLRSKPVDGGRSPMPKDRTSKDVGAAVRQLLEKLPEWSSNGQASQGGE